jgi:hypothetical protein
MSDTAINIYAALYTLFIVCIILGMMIWWWDLGWHEWQKHKRKRARSHLKLIKNEPSDRLKLSTSRPKLLRRVK